MIEHSINDTQARCNFIVNLFSLYIASLWSNFSMPHHDAILLFETFMHKFTMSNFRVYWNIGDFLYCIYQNDDLTEYDRAIFTKALICRCVVDTYAGKKFTKELKNFDVQLVDRLEIIYRNLNEKDDFYFSHVNDNVLKDIGISCGKLISARLLVYDRIDFPRSYIRHDLRIVPYLLKCGGYTNFLEGHLDETYISEFSEKGWKRSYLLLAEYLGANPQIKGLANKAWFYDPSLRHVSPHLAYLADICLAGEAKRFKSVTSAGDIKNALEKSRTCRRLYEEKKYVPQEYWILWSAKALVDWAKRERER